VASAFQTANPKVKAAAFVLPLTRAVLQVYTLFILFYFVLFCFISARYLLMVCSKATKDRLEISG
jgi:hypothetical protein